ncbi:unnamed protein product [Closterium sp. Yama58-4]|nr:unnamed protein product [Closterium sp. Yama58-4]
MALSLTVLSRWTSPLAASTKPCLKLEALRTIPRVVQACGNRMTPGTDSLESFPNESERHLLPYDMQLPVPYGWDTYTVLAAWLLRERAKGAASPWARFLRSLPAYVPLPALFPQTLIDDFEYWPIVDQATRLKAAYADLYDRCNGSNPTTIVYASSLPITPFLSSQPPSLPPPQATRLKAAYADLYDRCNPASIANATRSEFYWALTIVTSRCFTFSPSLRARGDGEEQQAGGTEGAEAGGDGGADGADGADGAAEVAAEVNKGMATEEAGGDTEEGSSGSSSSSSGGGRDGGGSRVEDWYATSAAMLPFADLFNHDYYPNMGWKVRDGR